MITDEQRARLQEAGAQALEGFRDIFNADDRQKYKMTLVARNAEHTDGSRDVIITEDEWQPLLDAIAQGRAEELAP